MTTIDSSSVGQPSRNAPDNLEEVSVSHEIHIAEVLPDAECLPEKKTDGQRHGVAHGQSLAEIQFDTIMPEPKRERSLSCVRRRRKPPSYELTSCDSMEFVRDAASKNSKKKKRNTSAKKNVNESEQPKMMRRKEQRRTKLKLMTTLRATNARRTTAPMMIQSHEEQWSCRECKNWFHSSCAEEAGLLDDDSSYYCAHCIYIL